MGEKVGAVEDQSAPIPEEIMSELGGIICNLVRRPQLKASHILVWLDDELGESNVYVRSGRSSRTPSHEEKTRKLGRIYYRGTADPTTREDGHRSHSRLRGT